MSTWAESAWLVVATTLLVWATHSWVWASRDRLRHILNAQNPMTKNDRVAESRMRAPTDMPRTPVADNKR